MHGTIAPRKWHWTKMALIMIQCDTFILASGRTWQHSNCIPLSVFYIYNDFLSCLILDHLFLTHHLALGYSCHCISWRHIISGTAMTPMTSLIIIIIIIMRPYPRFDDWAQWCDKTKGLSNLVGIKQSWSQIQCASHRWMDEGARIPRRTGSFKDNFLNASEMKLYFLLI